MTVPPAAADRGRSRRRAVRGAAANRRSIPPLAALALLAGAGLWLGWQAGQLDWERIFTGNRPFGSQEVVIDIGAHRSPTEVEIALANPLPQQPASETRATVESMLGAPDAPPLPEIEAPAPRPDAGALAAAAALPAAHPEQPSSPAPSTTASSAVASSAVRPKVPPASTGPSEAASGSEAAAGSGEGALYPLSLPAWRRNARPFDINDPRPRIAIVLVGLGPLHGITTAAIERLPAEVSLSFDPYDQGLAEWTWLARALGHEILLDLPAGGAPVAQAGADLPAGWSHATGDLQRLDWVTGRTSGYVGLAVASGNALSASPAGRGSVLSAIGRRGLLVLDTSPGDASLDAGATFSLPRVAVDIDIDTRPDRLAIDERLAALEARARQTGFAVGIAKGYPVTIDRLIAWSRALQEKNLALAPVSALAAEQSIR
ncbi:MAG TPA: divergent polysaccharide deacetylase family protein [Dongiaceae bacterium]|nr:divergent polysaccharide deacetylase family protein [Dongiaceae bacterium]